MIIHTMDQYSPEWWAIREGLPTASTADKVLTPGGLLSTSSRGLMCQLIADKLGFADEPAELSFWTERGKEMEPDARALFIFDSGLDVREVGFVTNDGKTAGCSPDSLIYEDDKPVAGLEIKCPMAKTQVGYLIKDELPAFYKPQVHWSLAVTGLPVWWFMTFFPGLDPLIVTVERDEYTEKIVTAIAEFSARLEAESKRFGLTRKAERAE
jgi:putative phage-type endonuclease